MAASLGDYLQFDVVATYLGQEIHNVFYYKVNSITGLGGTYLDDLASWIRDNVMDKVRALQVDELVYSRIDSRNLTNNLDFATTTFSAAGSISATEATSLPSSIAMTFRLNRETLATRNGWKRFAGGYEENLDGNVWTLTGTPVTNVEAALAADIILGLVNVAQPVILKRPFTPPVASTHISSGIGTATFRTVVGTQNSRKPGVGI